MNKNTPKKRITRQQAKRDRSNDQPRNTSVTSKKRKLNRSNERQKETRIPVIATPEIDVPSTSKEQPPRENIPDENERNQPARISSQESSDSDSPVNIHGRHG